MKKIKTLTPGELSCFLWLGITILIDVFSTHVFSWDLETIKLVIVFYLVGASFEYLFSGGWTYTSDMNKSLFRAYGYDRSVFSLALPFGWVAMGLGAYITYRVISYPIAFFIIIGIYGVIMESLYLKVFKLFKYNWQYWGISWGLYPKPLVFFFLPASVVVGYFTSIPIMAGFVFWLMGYPIKIF